MTSQPAGYWVRHVKQRRHVSRRVRVLRCDIVRTPRRMQGSGCGEVIVGPGRRHGVAMKCQGMNTSYMANKRVCMCVYV